MRCVVFGAPPIWKRRTACSYPAAIGHALDAKRLEVLDRPIVITQTYNGTGGVVVDDRFIRLERAGTLAPGARVVAATAPVVTTRVVDKRHA